MSVQVRKVGKESHTNTNHKYNQIKFELISQVGAAFSKWWLHTCKYLFVYILFYVLDIQFN